MDLTRITGDLNHVFCTGSVTTALWSQAYDLSNITAFDLVNIAIFDLVNITTFDMVNISIFDVVNTSSLVT